MTVVKRLGMVYVQGEIGLVLRKLLGWHTNSRLLDWGHLDMSGLVGRQLLGPENTGLEVDMCCRRLSGFE